MATGVEQPPGELGSACSIAFHAGLAAAAYSDVQPV